jgi:hypothetical protein
MRNIKMDRNGGCSERPVVALVYMPMKFRVP